MKNKIILSAAWILCAVFSQAAETLQPLPQGWSVIGNKKESYSVGKDPILTGLGKSVAVIRCKESKLNATMFGGLMQSFKADKYRGKRILFTAQIKTKGADHGAGLWMRVDGANKEVLSFDNMQERALTGDADWRTANIILNVPENAKAIFYGALLYGNGQAWITGMKFETVGKEFNLTDIEKYEQEDSLPLEPMNLMMLK